MCSSYDGNFNPVTYIPSNYFDSFTGGFQRGWELTFNNIKSQFTTWDGYSDVLLDALTLGNYSGVRNLSSLYSLIKNVPDYSADDYFYAGGFVAEKLVELVVLKKIVTLSSSTVGASGRIMIQFGKTEDQIYHTFRHTDALGLDRALVRSTVENHFKSVSSHVVAGKPFNQVIEIGGQRVQYTAFKLSDGTFNIGRIHGIK